VVTDAQLDEYRSMVETLNGFFLAGVADGRKMDPAKVAELATGQVWIGKQAVDAGLIDGVSIFDVAVATARFMAAKAKNKQEARRMAAATYQEIVAACPGADPAFICEQLKAGASAEQSVKDFIAAQQLELEAARKEAAEAKAAAVAARKSDAGVSPLPAAPQNKTAIGADSREEWEAAIDAKIAAGIPRPRAVAAVARARPDLREEMVAAANASRRR
jgi:ClpP class serine protease